MKYKELDPPVEPCGKCDATLTYMHTEEKVRLYRCETPGCPYETGIVVDKRNRH